MKNHKFFLGFSIVFAILMIFVVWQPVFAARKSVFKAKPGTIEIGKQGLFLSNIPYKISYVEINKIKPPLAPRYSMGIDIAYRGPVLEVTFLNDKKAPIDPSGITASVYFNVSDPEVRLWNEGGIDEIAIWYYNESAKNWQMCPSRLIHEKLNNGKYDRMTCMVMGNGIYMLGKMEFDPVFPLWFKSFDSSNQVDAAFLVPFD